MIRLPVLVATLLLVLAAPASAREVVVRSFDGTELHVSFHPAKAGKRAPTILMTHGWGGKREQDPEGASSGANAGVGALRKGGFNVLTWDSRGFGESGGTVTIDYREERGPRRQGAAELARAPAGGQARRQARPARRHARRLVRGRDPVRRRRDRPPDRRDRPEHRVALADHLALPGGDDQGRLVEPAVRRRAERAARPAHHVRVRQRGGRRHAVGRGPGLVRLARARARWSSASRCRR